MNPVNRLHGTQGRPESPPKSERFSRLFGSPGGQALAAIREHAWEMAFAVLAMVAFVVLFLAGRHGTFYNDEWYFIGIPGIGGFADWMRPWAAHWSMVPLILWKTIFAVVGLQSYLPYLALLLAAHVAAGAGLFVLVRRMSGPFLALCAAVVFLLLGTAYQNLVFSFQLGMVLSVAFGLWAIAAFDSVDWHSRTVGALLVMASLASSAVGPAFAVAVGVELLADPRRRRAVLWLVPVALVFAAWYVSWGRAGVLEESGVNGSADPVTIASLVVLASPRFIAAVTGCGVPVGLVIYVGLIAAGGQAAVRRRLSPRAIGTAVGFVALIASIGLARADLGLEYVATTSRYLYEETAFALLAASALLGRRADFVPRTAGEGALTTAIAGVTVLVVGFNLAALPAGAQQFVDHAGETRAVLFLTDRYGPDRLSGPASPSREYRPYLPPPRELLEATAKYGRLDRDIFRQGVVFPPSPYDLDRALWRLVGGVVVPTPGTEPGTACLTIDGPGAVLLPVRNSVTILGAGEWTIGLTRWAPPQPSDAVTITLADGWYTVRVPDLGDSAMYRLDMRPPRTGARICEAGVSG